MGRFDARRSILTPALTKIAGSADSDNRFSRFGRAGEQAVPGEKFDHEAIEEPGLLHLAGMAGSGQSLQLAIGYTRLERKGALMAAVLAAGQDYSGQAMLS